ncbi:MAG: outer membrane lipoprotein carrier protein LolA [Cyclobacteriaceae bacterium]|jgi:outer membrane lipoprotein-sorting protein|nr:outer membrane lipoprotein carrier protein LolA [Cyclobacteriaceae bacterium]
MKKCVFAFVLTVFSLVAFAQYDPKAFEILEAMSKKYKSITAFEANISYTLTNDVEKINEEFKGKIAVKGDKFRLSLPEQEVINNGTTLWTYLPEAKEVNIDNFDPNSDDVNPSKIYEIYKKGFKYVHLGDGSEGGVPCDVVDLVPEKRDAQYFKIRMIISKKDKSIQSWTMFDRSGNRYKYSITKFTPNAKMDDAYFTFDAKKYPGVEVIDLRY